MLFKPKGIAPVKHSEFTGEEIYTIEDALLIVTQVLDKPYYAIWGGDILDSRFDYTYDSWHYDGNIQKSPVQINQESCLAARSYLENYMTRNGTHFHVILVISNGMGVPSHV
jgi:hypothetical protein